MVRPTSSNRLRTVKVKTGRTVRDKDKEAVNIKVGPETMESFRTMNTNIGAKNSTNIGKTVTKTLLSTIQKLRLMNESSHCRRNWRKRRHVKMNCRNRLSKPKSNRSSLASITDGTTIWLDQTRAAARRLGCAT